MINGDFAFRGGASTTIGAGLSGALILGARLLLLALDGATDISLALLLLFLDVNEDALDRGEVVRIDSESLLEATSVWSSHPWTWPNLSSDSVTLVATWAWSLDYQMSAIGGNDMRCPMPDHGIVRSAADHVCETDRSC